MVKNCASRWSFTKNHNMMHGQQNVISLNSTLKTQLVGFSETSMFIFSTRYHSPECDSLNDKVGDK
jgi:hypothetical protein